MSKFSAYLSTTGSVWLRELTLGMVGWAALGVCSSRAGAGQGDRESLLSCTQSRSCKIQNKSQIAPQNVTARHLRNGVVPKAAQVLMIEILLFWTITSRATALYMGKTRTKAGSPRISVLSPTSSRNEFIWKDPLPTPHQTVPIPTANIPPLPALFLKLTEFTTA